MLIRLEEISKLTNDPIEVRLAALAGRRTFDHEVAAMIRGGRFEVADKFLMDALRHARTKIADAARACNADAVRISGWDAVHAECARLLAAKISIGAIGLNLSNYNDSSTSVWHDKEPAIEFAVYGTDAFDFLSATIEEILRASAEPPTPWQGRMMPLEPQVVPSISGLRTLNSALLEYDNESPWRPASSDNAGRVAAPEEYVAFVLGEWMLHLRFHQAVWRDMRLVGLPTLVPVLIGAHDVGPFIVSVVVPGRVSERPADIVTHVAARSGGETQAPKTEQFVAELDEMRRTIQSLGLFSRAKKRALIEQSEAREAQLLAAVGGLAWPRRTWEMTDTQFKAFAHAFRLAHEVSREAPDARPPKSP